MSERRCSKCSRLCEVLSEETSRCREWEILGGGVLKERYFERKSDGCTAFKKKADEKQVQIERGLALSDGFFDNARRWKGRRNKKC